MVKVHINNTKHITIANIYIPPRDTTSTHYKTADTDIQHCIQYIPNIPHSVLTGDVNAHFTLWHSYTDDHRGQLIADVISNSDHITLNNTPTRVPNTTLQQTSSLDITRVSNTLYDRTINNKALPMATHPKVQGLTLDPKLTYSTHIHNISVQAHTPLQIIKALTATGWGKQKDVKTGVPQGGVLSPTLFNIYTSDLPPPSAPVQVMAYADDITITSTHTSTSAAKKYIQPYLHKVFAGTKQNNLLLNPDKTTCTLFTPDPAEYTSNLDLTINNKALPMATHPKVLGLTLDPKLTYSTHIHNISVQAHKPLQIIKALTATGWGKQKETLMVTYKAVMRPALEYASSVWSPIASSTSINKLQVMQNAALRTATGCTQDTNIQHLHDETLTLPIHEHLQLHASQYKQKTQHPSHPLHKHTTYFNIPRLKRHYF